MWATNLKLLEVGHVKYLWMSMMYPKSKSKLDLQSAGSSPNLTYTKISA